MKLFMDSGYQSLKIAEETTEKLLINLEKKKYYYGENINHGNQITTITLFGGMLVSGLDI